MASWNYTLYKINQSFDRIAHWYKDFMHRTAQSFLEIHQRLLFLEERQAWRGPSDEQVERVLRKILHEKFGDANSQPTETPRVAKQVYFLEKPVKEFVPPEPIPVEAATLEVDPDSVPSKVYQENLQMLENQLHTFPDVDLSKTASQVKTHHDTKGSPAPATGIPPSSNPRNSDRPW